MDKQDKYCPMSLPSTQYKDMTVCKGSQCAWYIDDGCAIVVLAQHKKQGLQVTNCYDVFELPI